jgi:serine/threonine-protein kinase
VSPAEALHGRYRQTATQSNGFREEHEYVVRTDCLRAGDRCMSLFHHPPGAALALVFGDGGWLYDREVDSPCQRGGALSHVHISAQFPLPSPPQDPVTLIAGHGRQDISGPPSPCKSSSFEMSFARLGD